MNEEIVKAEPVSSTIVNATETLSNSYLVEARGVIITNDDQLAIASTKWNEGRKMLVKVEAEKKSGTDPLNVVVNKIRGWFKPFEDNIKAGQAIYANAINAYNKQKQEAVDKENVRLKAVADAEAKKLAERAAKAEASGKVDKAADLLAQAQMKKDMTPQVVNVPVKVAGVAIPKKYYGAVKPENKMTFVTWAIKTENWDLLLVNDKEISEIAKRSKGTRVIPGVTFWDENKIQGSR